MTFSEWMSLIGIFAGPVIAVAITLLWTNYSDKQRRREAVLASLVLHRNWPGSHQYVHAMSLVPLEFRERDVQNAWSACIDAANKQVAEQRHVDDVVQAMMKALGYKIDHAGSIIRGAYISKGLVESISRQEDAMKAIIRLADAMEKIESNISSKK